MFVSAIVAAGGRGVRLGADRPKQFLDIGDGKTMIELSLEALTACARVNEVVVAVPRAWLQESGGAGLTRDVERIGTAVPVIVVEGGDRRQDSVARAFSRISPAADIVVIHDAARPFASAALIERTILAARDHGAAVAAVQAVDTVKQMVVPAEGAARVVRATLPRETIFLAQTPQAFQREILAQAMASAGDVAATDEAMLVERAGFSVHLVDGESTNIKVTTAGDLAMARDRLVKGRHTAVDTMRIGTGYDLHRLVDGRPLILAGVRVPFERGLLGHSDADIVCHAVTDAMLGAAAAGDIGRLFPDTDPRWKDADSLASASRSRRGCPRAAGFQVGNVDVTVIAQSAQAAAASRRDAREPRRRPRCRRRVVSVKGKTNEGRRRDRTRRSDGVPRGRLTGSPVARRSCRPAVTYGLERCVSVLLHPHRPPARRQRAHGAVQLAARAARPAARSSCVSRTPTSSGRRVKSERAIIEDLRWLGLTWDEGVEVGGALGPVSADRAPRHLRGSRTAAARRRTGVSLLLFAGKARGGSSGAARAGPAADDMSARADRFRRDAAAARIAAGERPVVRLRVPVESRGRVRRRGPRPCGVSHRRHRRPGARALGRHSRLQLRRGDRRCADARDARGPRRGSHLEHAAADAALRGVRLDAAGLRASVAGDGTGSHAALEAPRRDVGGRVPREGLSPGGARQLSRAHRLVAGRGQEVLPLDELARRFESVERSRTAPACSTRTSWHG